MQTRPLQEPAYSHTGHQQSRSHQHRRCRDPTLSTLTLHAQQAALPGCPASAFSGCHTAELRKGRHMHAGLMSHPWHRPGQQRGCLCLNTTPPPCQTQHAHRRRRPMTSQVCLPPPRLEVHIVPSARKPHPATPDPPPAMTHERQHGRQTLKQRPPGVLQAGMAVRQTGSHAQPP